MPTNGKRYDVLAHLADWVENGAQPLDEEMMDTLQEPELPKEAPAAVTKRTRKKKTFQRKKDPARTGMPDALTARSSFGENPWYRLLAVCVCVGLIGFLLYAAMEMPRFGNADTLVDSEVTSFYVRHTKEETGAMNIVTGIILDYRGFDTLGESHVLFVAVSTVLLLLSIKGEKDEREQLSEAIREEHAEPEQDLILQGAARILVPLILIFGIYILLNGHLSPGGGFSGGAVLGAGLILYQNAFGYHRIERFFTYRTFQAVSLVALLFYALSKGYHFLTGANHLDSMIPTGTPGAILSGGLLLPLNIAVGCVVTCTMYALYTMFRRGDF